MTRQAGFAQLYVLAGIVTFAAVIGGGAWLTYQHAISRAEAAEAALYSTQAELAVEKANNVMLAAEKAAQGLVFQARQERTSAATAKQAETDRRADIAAEKRSAEAIAATSIRDAEKYTKFVKRVLPKNIKTLQCRSDLRTVLDDKACTSTIQ